MNVTIFSKAPNKVQEQHLNTLINMFAWMEVCGSIGHYTDFRVNYDGDGRARMVFGFGIDQEKYEELKKQYLKEYQEHGTEPKVFSFD